jgi:hypothetical protein
MNTQAPVVFVTIDEWKRMSGDSRSTIYESLGDGRLRAVKDGRRTKIDAEHGLAQMRGLPPAPIRSAKKRTRPERLQT